MVNQGRVVDEVIVVVPGRISMSASEALKDDVIAISYALVVPYVGTRVPVHTWTFRHPFASLLTCGG